MSNNLEMRIKSEFDSIDVDLTHILRLEKYNSDKRARVVSKDRGFAVRRRNIRRSVRLSAVLAAILLAVSVTVLAVGSYLGAFDRLRGIIGEEQAGRLQPVEIISNAGGGVDNSESIGIVTDGGIRIEIVAIGILSNVVDFYFTLEDLVEDRLDGDIMISAMVTPGDLDFDTAVIENPRIIDRTDDGIVTLHSRQRFSTPISGQEMQFRLRSISYNRKNGEYKTDFDLSSLETSPTAAWLWDTPVLPPHLHDISLNLEGFENTWDTRVSSIGIIDGKLHIQQEQAPPSTSDNAWVHFCVMDPQGAHVEPYIGPHWPLSILSFRIDESGGFSNDNTGIYADITPDLAHLPFREDIYEVDLGRLSEYSLVALYHTEERIDLNWEVSFMVDIPGEGAELVADGLGIELENCRAILREVRITPYNVLISADYIDASPVSPNPEIAINTIEGIVTPVAQLTMFTNRFDDYDMPPVGFTMVLDLVETSSVDAGETALFDLDSVVSIIIDGHTIEFR